MTISMKQAPINSVQILSSSYTCLMRKS